MSKPENPDFSIWVINKFFADLREKDQDLQVSAMIRDQLSYVILYIGLELQENCRLYTEECGESLIISSEADLVKLLDQIKHLLQTQHNW